MINGYLSSFGGTPFKWGKVVLLGVSLFLTAGCESNKRPLDPNLGNSVLNNMNVHIVKPRVPKPNSKAPDLEGARAFRAINRYHLGDTEKPKEESTTKSGGGEK
jgi:hypothetical protein